MLFMKERSMSRSVVQLELPLLHGMTLQKRWREEMPRYKTNAIQRWPFRFKMRNGKEHVYWMKAIPAWSTARPWLKAEHVLESIKRQGAADTQNCVEAVCAQRNPQAFDHEVEGTVDFTYRRVAVVSKIYKEPRKLPGRKKYVTGECVVYEHDHSDIAHLNDSKNGQKKLLKRLQKKGPIQQHFRPLRVSTRRNEPVPKTGRRTGTHTRYRRGKARAAFAAAAFAIPGSAS